MFATILDLSINQTKMLKFIQINLVPTNFLN